VWARHWYSQVYRSTGFETPREAEPEVPEQFRGLIEQVMPSYELLFAQRLRP
jgi:hypothetical protein